MSPTAPRRSVALLLACLGPGLGQLYLGRNVRGFTLLLLGLSFVPVAVIVANASPSPALLGVLLAASAVAVLAMLVGLVDAAIPNAQDGLRPPPTPRALATGIAALVVVGLVLGIGGALWVRGHLLEAFKIASGSMEPGLAPGDRVLVGKRTTWNRPLRRGDIVVYRAPGEGVAYVKRVVGLPGESIAVPGQDEAVAVPAGTCFVLGDRREESKDSRHHGPVPLSSIVGVVRYRYWPPSRMGVVD